MMKWFKTEALFFVIVFLGACGNDEQQVIEEKPTENKTQTAPVVTKNISQANINDKNFICSASSTDPEVKQFSENLKAVTNSFLLVNKMRVKDVELAAKVEELTQALSNNGLKIKQTKSQQAIVENGITKRPFSFSTEGSLAQTFKFIERLEELNKTLSISSTVERLENDQVTMDIEVTFPLRRELVTAIHKNSASRSNCLQSIKEKINQIDLAIKIIEQEIIRNKALTVISKQLADVFNDENTCLTFSSLNLKQTPLTEINLKAQLNESKFQSTFTDSLRSINFEGYKMDESEVNFVEVKQGKTPLNDITAKLPFTSGEPDNEFVSFNCVIATSSQEKLKQLIRSAQTELTRLGLYNSNIDGVIGAGTSQAIRTYQELMGLTSTGTVNSNLVKRMRKTPDDIFVFPVNNSRNQVNSQVAPSNQYYEEASSTVNLDEIPVYNPNSVSIKPDDQTQNNIPETHQETSRNTFFGGIRKGFNRLFIEGSSQVDDETPTSDAVE